MMYVPFNFNRFRKPDCTEDISFLCQVTLKDILYDNKGKEIKFIFSPTQQELCYLIRQINIADDIDLEKKIIGYTITKTQIKQLKENLIKMQKARNKKPIITVGSLAERIESIINVKKERSYKDYQSEDLYADCYVV